MNDIWIFAERSALALVLGAIIGIERQRHSHPAGLRTNTLVALGSAFFVTLPYLIGGDSSPTRVAGQVVTGIGFLGAGVILREGLNVCGLNTAATLWCSSAIGVLSGSGLLAEACIGTAAIIFVNIVLRPAARLMGQPNRLAEQDVYYCIRITCTRRKEPRVRNLFLHFITKEANLTLQGLESGHTDQPDRMSVTASIISATKNDRLMEDIVARIGLEEGVIAVSWETAMART